MANAEALAANLARNLVYQRNRRSLTQQQLAKLSSVPRSTVANIETGVCNPTLSVLSRLAAALQLSLEELLSAPRADCELFPAGTLPGATRRGARVQKLLPHPIPGMEIDRMELARGEKWKGVPHRPGTNEYLYCEKGQLALWVAGERYALSPGDVAAFPGDQLHSYQNLGDTIAVGFSVVSLAPLR